MLGTIAGVFFAALTISMVILVHELGHFLAARAIGVRVEVFSIGFWKRVVGFKAGDTDYRISLIPLGGYIRPAGELVSDGNGESADDELHAKTPGRRAVFFVAGVTFNMLFALAAFIVAFAVGVPFEVAEVGGLEKGMPAWEAGLQVGDKITKIDDLDQPDFQDIVRLVALSGRETFSLLVDRDGEEMAFTINTRYDERLGLRRIGLMVPAELVITGLHKLDVGRQGAPDSGERRPAKEAGIEVGDVVVAINDNRVTSHAQMSAELRRATGLDVKVTVAREGREHTFVVRTQPVPRYVLGISGYNARIQSIQNSGLGRSIGLEKGDRIVRVGDKPVSGIFDVERTIKEDYGVVTLSVERDGGEVPLQLDVPDIDALDEFLFSIECESDNTMAWVDEEGAAWQASMRPGDTIVGINGDEIESWRDILTANARAGADARTVRWVRDGKESTATMAPLPQPEEGAGYMGVEFARPKFRVRRYSVARSVVVGLRKTVGQVREIIMMIRGFGSGDVSTKQLGSIPLIAVSSYQAARYGPGRLLYWAGIISTALAVLNILPIPVLDGGHLMFVAIEKLRGRPLNEKVMVVCQYIGLGLLLLLVVYAFWNDVVRFFGGLIGLS